MVTNKSGETEYLTTLEVAEILRCNRNTVFNLIQRGELQAIKAGPRQWLIPADEVTRIAHRRLPSAREAKERLSAVGL